MANKWITLLKSSFSDGFGTLNIQSNGQPVNTSTKLWRAVVSSQTCVLDSNNQNTGFVHTTTLEEYDSLTGVATGNQKANTAGDIDYIADFRDITVCPIPSLPAITAQVTNNTAYKYYVDIQDSGGNSVATFIQVVNGSPQTLNIPAGTNYTVVVKATNTHTDLEPNSVVINGVARSFTVYPGRTMPSLGLQFPNISSPIVITLS